jgi:hypothetical protein
MKPEGRRKVGRFKRRWKNKCEIYFVGMIKSRRMRWA